MEKKEIRKAINQQRRSLPESDKALAAKAVYEKLVQADSFVNAKKILFYYALPDELPTKDFLEQWCATKQFYLPRVNGLELDILPYDKSKLESGAYSIEEPVGDELLDPSKLDLIIVPAVAFDHSGNRLGRGKGFYDRLLCKTTAVKIGVGYDFQIIEDIPVESHDIPMDLVLTPNYIIKSA
jgi:5-formyltetrahydrofolate cyclo-ligase